MSLTQLYFNRVELSYVPPTVRVAPNFLCPICAGRPANLLAKTFNVALNRALEINQKVSFTFSCCGKTLELWLGVHQEKDSPIILLCLQRTDAEGATGIPTNWWVKP